MEKGPAPEQIRDIELLPEVKAVIGRFPYLKMVVEEICAHHETTLLHLKRSGNIAYQLAEKLGYSDNRKDLLVQAALSHDVGKYLLPHDTLNSKGVFDIKDWDLVRTHPEIGVDYIKEFAPLVAEIIKRHHQYQKNPYPRNIRYEGDYSEDERKTIEELSRVLALLEKIEALTGEREYKSAEKFEDFFVKLRENFPTDMDFNLIKNIAEISGASELEDYKKFIASEANKSPKNK
jgi:HD-GYP domain-containing protein (c-di-GMP phosphodiesterase class II)